MQKGLEIARGKTKILYEYPAELDQLVVVQTDAISAGDGARRDEIPGKGRLAAQTSARIFRLLNLCGLPTHYVNGGEDDDLNETLVRRCSMVPLEVVVRGVAAGSFVKRNPSVTRGSLLAPRVVEFFIKDDANHDPMISPDEIVARGIANQGELAAMMEIARVTFEVLAHAWRRREVLLVDLKIEFGRLASSEAKGQLVIADVIDNDSWRIWPQGREDLMLDKQMYRNLAQVDDAALAQIKTAYEHVADLVSPFPVMRPGMAAIFADGVEGIAQADELAMAIGNLGVPTIRRVVSATATPGYVLQAITQMETTFARLIVLAVGKSDALRAMLDHATSAPVLDGTEDAQRVALQTAKLLGLEDTVLYGRTLLVQANLRSAVLQADAALQNQAPGTALA